MGFQITTWNVNGIRNPFAYEPWRSKRTFEHMFNILEADIVIMQETKIQKKDLSDEMVLISGWDVYFSLPREKKGYSGVAIYTRNTTCAPIRAEEGITGCIAAPDRPRATETSRRSSASEATRRLASSRAGWTRRPSTPKADA
uniref:Endonuclease/exonuclease/phosphatase domain-containing protein n=1 Tax=Bionectria ochroleuca TaxID=29856 RepID=A0A8H7K4S2_BIOOC